MVWFPQESSYQKIDETLKKAVASDGSINESVLFEANARRYSGSIVPEEIYMENYNLVLKRNVKLEREGGFIHITSWKASYGKEGEENYRFGTVDVGVNLLGGSVLRS